MRLLAALLVTAAVALGACADHYHPADPAGRAAAAAANLAEADPRYWINQAQAAIAAHAQRAVPGGKARNVVMFLGDGMSIPTITAARTLLGQRRGATGEETQMSFESFPTTGLTKTYCVNSQVADSACSATAYLCGVKTNEGVLGLSAAVPRRNCAGAGDSANHVESIAAWALADGRDAGIVTTTRVTHASPAGAYARAAERSWETDADVPAGGPGAAACRDITHQLVHAHPGNKFKVILGGGRHTFLPTNVTDEEGGAGRRTDGRNLIEEWQQDKIDRNVTYRYIWNRTELLNLNSNLPEYLLGLFETSHMMYHLEADTTTEPTLSELTATAIKMLSRNEKGFFLFVEGGRIDHAHHDNLAHLALDETLEMEKAVTVALQLLSEEDSLVVVTADHAHVMAFNGYSPRGRDILGPANNRDRHSLPYMTLSYTNGPGFRSHVNGSRPDMTAEINYGNVRWPSHVDFPLNSETHGGDDVAVFARGPHHALFAGLYEQSHLAHRMAYAACLGPGRRACAAAAPAVRAPHALALLTAVVSCNLLSLRFKS